MVSDSERHRTENQVEVHQIESPWIAELASSEALLRPLMSTAKDRRYNTLSNLSSFQLNRENVTVIAYRSVRMEMYCQ